MRKHFRLTWVVLLLLTFMSQAMASSMMAYKMMANNISLENVRTINNHVISSHHQMDEMNTDATTTHHKKNCCSKQSTCVIVACSTIALTNDIYIQHLVSVSTLEYSRYTERAFSQQPKSLYRPPILG